MNHCMANPMFDLFEKGLKVNLNTASPDLCLILYLRLGGPSRDFLLPRRRRLSPISNQFFGRTISACEASGRRSTKDGGPCFRNRSLLL